MEVATSLLAIVRGAGLRSFGLLLARIFRRSCTVALIVSTLMLPLCATRLPVRVFTTADGLPRSFTSCIVTDRKGFLWLCTAEGAARYDGYSFALYGIEQGLPDRRVNDILETRSGAYFFATYAGVSRLEPSAAPDSARRFVTLAPGGGGAATPVYALLEDRAGAVWCATDRGIYRFDPTARRPELQYLTLNRAPKPSWVAVSLAEDRDGSLWIGTTAGLCRRWPDGRVEWHVELGPIYALMVDRRGHLWAGTSTRLVEFRSTPAAPVAIHSYTSADGLQGEEIYSLLELRRGNAIWAGTSTSLNELDLRDDQPARIHSYGADAGLSGRLVAALAEDAQGNIWAGADHGLMRISSGGFATFGDADGIGSRSIVQISEDNEGLWAASSQPGGLSLHLLRNGHFDSVRPRYGKTTTGFGNDQVVLHTRCGEWWIATGGGLYRFPAVRSLRDLAGTPPQAVYREAQDLPGPNIYRLFEDSRGDIWVTSMWAGLSRWDSRRRTFQHYPEFSGYATAFAEDRAGNVWIGFSTEPSLRQPNGVRRYRLGRFETFTESGGVSTGWVRELFVDRSGKLWVGTTNAGLLTVDQPAAEHPHLARYTEARTSSMSVFCIAEDHSGRLFVGTARGVDRIDTSSGRVRRYTSADGLAMGDPASLYCDRQGRIWVGGSMGLSLLNSEPAESPRAARIFITGLSINGRPRPVGEPSAESLSGIHLAPDQRQMRVAFVATGAPPGEALRYQHMLEGAESQWSPLTDEREVSYMKLGTGDFRFLVRAATDQGAVSAPAAVSFHVDAPVWLRWWFLTLDVAILGALAIAIHRYDLSRRLEVERMRLRIARDLHDDLGASLTRVAILSELARSGIAKGEGNVSGHLSDVAEAARGMVDGLGDLVWAIDPRRDDLGSTSRRIRQYASDLLETKGIQWSFQAPASAAPPMAPDQRRHVLLFFQETLRNAARHAGCSSVTMSLQVSDREWSARIADNGRGMPASRPDAEDDEFGNGLRNLRGRAASLGGTLVVVSEPGRGTELTLRFPQAASRGPMGRMRMLFRGASKSPRN